MLAIFGNESIDVLTEMTAVIETYIQIIACLVKITKGFPFAVVLKRDPVLVI